MSVEWVWLVPALPLFAALFNALIGRKLPRVVVSIVAVGSVGAAFLVALAMFANLLGASEPARHVVLYSWIPVADFTVNVSFLLDPLSATMLLVVAGVGFLIHLYSVGYMADDAGYARYFVYLNLFAFSMLLLVLADNFLLLYVGWELVGLCSYLLIGFWFHKKAAAEAGKKAFIVNRVGDFGFALGVILIFLTFGSLNYADVFEKAPQLFSVGAPVATIITLLLFMGATGKSAQIPLYVWLPDAMEGPTPVSALIHAATMVTAGVYMVARSHVLFALAPFSSSLVAIIGVVTALYAATIALTQVDLKRVLAYSTISQLGYMFLGAGVGAYSAAIFHLMTHAFFKALLFLAAGSAMHALHVDVLDIRKAGGLAKYARVTWFTFLVGALALAGFPGLSGFFSKDEILAKTFESGNVGLWALGLLTAGLTAFYIFRAFILTFHGEERWKQVKSQKSEVKSHDHPISKLQSPISNLHPHESPAVMTVPLVLLAILAIIGGYVGLPAVFGGSQFEAFLAPVFGEAHQAVPNAGLELALIGASVLAALFGIGFAYLFYVARQDFPARLAATYPEIYTLLVNKYYVDEIYNALFVQPLKALANFFWQFVDGRIIDGAANGAGYGIARLGQVFRRAESGYVRAYALAMVIGVVVILAVVVLR